MKYKNIFSLMESNESAWLIVPKDEDALADWAVDTDGVSVEFGGGNKGEYKVVFSGAAFKQKTIEADLKKLSKGSPIKLELESLNEGFEDADESDSSILDHKPINTSDYKNKFVTLDQFDSYDLYDPKVLNDLNLWLKGFAARGYGSVGEAVNEFNTKLYGFGLQVDQRLVMTEFATSGFDTSNEFEVFYGEYPIQQYGEDLDFTFALTVTPKNGSYGVSVEIIK